MHMILGAYEQTSLSFFIDYFFQIRTFFYQSLGWLGLLLESHSCWVGAGFENVNKSAVGFKIGGFIARSSGSCGSLVVPGLIRLSTLHCSVDWR